jgi:hypothetical protein
MLLSKPSKLRKNTLRIEKLDNTKKSQLRKQLSSSVDHFVCVALAFCMFLDRTMLNLREGGRSIR